MFLDKFKLVLLHVFVHTHIHAAQCNTTYAHVLKITGQVAGVGSLFLPCEYGYQTHITGSAWQHGIYQ